MSADATTSGNHRFPTSTDYLVVGAGALGMAFVDTLLHEGQPTPKVMIVDSQKFPGGHWLTSYNFVQLHAPAFLYGVDSLDLVVGKSYVGGCSAEKVARIRDRSYFAQRVGRERLVEYYSTVLASWTRKFPEHIYFAGGWEYVAAVDRQPALSKGAQVHCIRSIDTEELHDVVVHKKLVLANYCMPETPYLAHSHGKRPFQIDIAAQSMLVPINDIYCAECHTDLGHHSDHASSLATTSRSRRQYLVVGGGKTGLDAVTYLQRRLHVAAERIFWIIPNDSYFVNRDYHKSLKKNLSMVCALADNPFMASRSASTLHQMLVAAGVSEDLKKLEAELNEAFSKELGNHNIGRTRQLFNQRQQLFAQAGMNWFAQNSSSDPKDEEHFFKHISPKALPTKFRVGFTDGEEVGLAQNLDSIGHVYRGSRVKRITFDKLHSQVVIHFCDGRDALLFPIEDPLNTMQCSAGLHHSFVIVDCTSSVMKPVLDCSGANKPVFEGALIRIQYLCLPPPCVSAAVIAKIETMTTLPTDGQKNTLVPLRASEEDLGHFRLSADGSDFSEAEKTLSDDVSELLKPGVFLWNAPARWVAEPSLRKFLDGTRLSTRYWNGVLRCSSWIVPNSIMRRRWRWLLEYF